MVFPWSAFISTWPCRKFLFFNAVAVAGTQISIEVKPNLKQLNISHFKHFTDAYTALKGELLVFYLITQY